MVVRWHWLAEEQLKEIFDYHLKKAGHKTAKKIVVRIKEYTATLGMMPFIGPVELSLESEPEEYRSLVIPKKYKAIYHVDTENNSVIIVDLWDCRQSPESLKERVAETTEV
jgi:plasmid stabilization system protein ParE